MLKKGDHLLVSHRRLFAEDQPRFFTGTVDEHELGVVMATGYSWVRDAFTGDFVRNADKRTKVFSLVSGSLIVYCLPETCQVDALEIVHNANETLLLRDPAGFEMDMTERHPYAARSAGARRQAS
jgi:hypothetical protein